MTYDTQHVTHDKGHVTNDMSHVTHGGRLTFSKNVKSLTHTFGSRGVLKIVEQKDVLPTESVTKVIVKQPRLHWSVNDTDIMVCNMLCQLNVQH